MPNACSSSGQIFEITVGRIADAFDPQRRRRAAAIAGHAHDVATARSLLGDDDPGVRATAIGALARAGALAGADLDRAAGDPASAVRRRAAQLAAHADEVLPAGLLLRLLDDSDTSVVEMAAWACGERSPADPGAVARLADLAHNHDDALVREAAVAALGAIGDDAGLPAVLAACGDRPPVRRRAVLALAAFEGAEVEAALRRALDDRDWQVRQAAEDLLGR